MSERLCGSSLVSLVNVPERICAVRFNTHVRHVDDGSMPDHRARFPRSHPLPLTMADQQKLCHEFSHDIEPEQTVFAAAEQAEDRLVYSGIDEILQPLGAMLRGS